MQALPPATPFLLPVLDRFEPAGVTGTGHATLQDRRESKYLLTLEQARILLGQIPASYQVLEVNGERIQSYRSTYYDFPDLQLFQDHHRGRGHRFKVRTRSYPESDLHFLEIKEKLNTGRTVKHRLRTDLPVTSLGSEEEGFLSAYLPGDHSRIRPVLRNLYSRITLFPPDRPERFTLDIGLSYQQGEGGISLPGLVIAELKETPARTGSPVRECLASLHLRSRGFSKYCIGISLLYGDQVRWNNFRMTLRHLAWLMQGGPVRW